MANLFTKLIPTSVAKNFYTMKKLTSKLQRTVNNLFFLLFLFDHGVFVHQTYSYTWHLKISHYEKTQHQIYNNVFLYYPYLIIANLLIKHHT